MLLQEVRQSDTEKDGDRRMFQHDSIHQYGTDGSTKKKTHSLLPDERYQYGVFDTGQSMQFNKDEVSKEAKELGRGQRKKKPTMKGIEYKTSLMKERRDKVYARLMRKCAAIEDLFYSSRNITAVQEEMCQFNDQLKLLMSLHEEIHTILEVEEEKIESDEWINMIEEQIFNFNRKVHNWIKNAEEDQISLQSNKSHLSRGSSVKARSSRESIVSKRSSCSNKSDNSKTRAVEEKAKLAELLAEDSFLINRQMA